MNGLAFRHGERDREVMKQMLGAVRSRCPWTSRQGVTYPVPYESVGRRYPGFRIGRDCPSPDSYPTHRLSGWVGDHYSTDPPAKSGPAVSPPVRTAPGKAAG